jgi:hypothetical protein
MNAPSPRFREFVTAAAMTFALAATSLTAVAGDDASDHRRDPSRQATERVAARLADRIDSTLAAEIARDVRPTQAAAQAPTRIVDASSGVERQAAARERSRASIEERAQEHKRVYIAIRERPTEGVLVQ